MNPILRNILAVIGGFAFGSAVNMAILMLNGILIPLPEGADVSTNEGLKASMHLFGPRHFIFPFLAHALGTFGGAFLAGSIAATHKLKFALAIGGLFLIGGITMIFMLPSPTWFTVLDVVGAYIPMAYLGGKLAVKKTKPLK